MALPLVIAGDIHDSKANLRGECIKAIMDIIETASTKPAVLVANHDRINEKSFEHSLEFLRHSAVLINEPKFSRELSAYFIPYYSDPDSLRAYIKTLPPRSTLIMHQGITGSNMGDYVIDKSAIAPSDVHGHRVISGHYHARQTIHLPDGGVWDYIGSPYTMSYGEANDPDKGFQILMDDGSLEFVPTNLRKHIVHECSTEDTSLFLKCPSFKEKDLLWVKVRDTKEKLQGFTKNYVRMYLSIQDTQDFRLDLIPTDTTTTSPKPNLSKYDIMDSLIDSLTNTSDDCKARLRDKWKSMI